MLTITVPAFEGFDEESQEFVKFPEATMDLEHSLVALSKWEAIWEKPFMSADVKTTEQTLSYIECMNLNSDAPIMLTRRLTDQHINEVNAYIDKKMTATWFREDLNPRGAHTREVITSELIYYWMVALTIPFECQYWHLNRLLTLVRVCNEKNKPEKKMSRTEIAANNRALNEQRKAQRHTRG